MEGEVPQGHLCGLSVCSSILPVRVEGPMVVIVGISFLVQLITIIYALRLISLTGWRGAWALLALSATTMGIRRAIIFFDSLGGGVEFNYDMTYELFGLAGSGMMLAGVFLIKPILLVMMEAEREQRELAERLQTALSQVTTLKGMLPICASCKKIRNDAGYWEILENYISSHSEAEFSHGICPECIEKLYPDLYEKMKRSKAKKIAPGKPPK